MRKLVAVFAWLVATATSFAQPNDQLWQNYMADRDVVLLDATQEDGSRLRYTARADTISNTPPWDGKGEPPFSFSKAVALAAEYLTQKYPGFSRFELQRVGLTRIHNADIANRWFFHIVFSGNTRVNNVDVSKPMNVIMLLNGTIVESKVVNK